MTTVPAIFGLESGTLNTAVELALLGVIEAVHHRAGVRLLERMWNALAVPGKLSERMGKIAGYEYLRATVDKHRAYNDLFAIATFLIPRSALPPLPDDVRKSMRYRYET